MEEVFDIEITQVDLETLASLALPLPRWDEVTGRRTLGGSLMRPSQRLGRRRRRQGDSLEDVVAEKCLAGCLVGAKGTQSFLHDRHETRHAVRSSGEAPHRRICKVEPARD